jgi:sensor histidine kinase YesM
MGLVFLIIFLSVVFDVWVTKFSLVDFYGILEENARSSELSTAMEEESLRFEEYIRNPVDTTEEALSVAMAQSRKALDAFPFDYQKIGEERYAKVWSLRNLYEGYSEKRDAVLAMDETEESYISSLYEVYELQQYLQSDARALMTDTIEAGNAVYQTKVPRIIRVPVVIVVVAILLLVGMVQLAKLMYRTLISPILQLTQTSKRIVANDFFVEDVTVENKDELGDLVAAFNKMKFAAGEYILALEERRKTLELLHEEELEKLEVEKQLETIKLDLLKSQVNPHFLFNTLNVISGMANLEGAETTEKMITALSSLFRYNLKTTDVEVPLVQELKVLQDYMYLQQMRFGSRVRCEVDCQVNKENAMVPSFTFQPLVENAVIHGLAKKESGGVIRVRVWERQHRLLITIGDSGIGMKPEVLRQIREQIRGGGKNTVGIGLGNIYKRIYAMYPEGSFEIFSKENAGTVISIGIPQND